MEKQKVNVNVEAIETAIFHNTLIRIGKNADGTICLYNADTGEVVIDVLTLKQ